MAGIDNAEDAPKETAAGDNNTNHKKEALMRMIAQEMVTSLLGNEDGDGDGDSDDEAKDDELLQNLQKRLALREKSRKSKKKSKRSGKKPKKREEQRSRGAPGDDLEVAVKDSDSFADGDLDHMVQSRHRPRRASQIGSISGLSVSQSSNPSASGSLEDNTFTGTTSTGSTSRDTNKTGELSIDEIRRYVMEHIPHGVREQIPEEAWAQIFNPDSAKTSKASANSGSCQSSNGGRHKVQIEGPIDEIVGNYQEDDDEDDMTVISDISGLTSAFPDGRRVEYNQQVLARTEPVVMTKEESFHRRLAPEAPGEYDEIAAPRSGRNSLATTSSYRSKSKMTVTKGSGSIRASAKKVGFDQVEVRYYERAISDNPSVQSGAGVGLGWRYKRGGRVDIEHWEQGRGDIRSSSELVMPRHVRERLLLEAGFSQKEIAGMVRLTLKAKNQRKQTVNNLPSSGVEEAVEKARRKVSRLLRFGKSKDIIRK